MPNKFQLDMWRAKAMLCSNCLYFDDENCRKNPPHIDGDGGGVWPRVAPNDWCGDFTTTMPYALDINFPPSLVSPKTAKVIEEAGIQTLGDLLKFGRAKLARLPYIKARLSRIDKFVEDHNVSELWLEDDVT